VFQILRKKLIEDVLNLITLEKIEKMTDEFIDLEKLGKLAVGYLEKLEKLTDN